MTRARHDELQGGDGSLGEADRELYLRVNRERAALLGDELRPIKRRRG